MMHRDAWRSPSTWAADRSTAVLYVQYASYCLTHTHTQTHIQMTKLLKPPEQNNNYKEEIYITRRTKIKTQQQQQ